MKRGTQKDSDSDAFLSTLEQGVKEVLADETATAAERIAAVTAGAKLLAIKHKLSSDDEKNFFTK